MRRGGEPGLGLDGGVVDPSFGGVAGRTVREALILLACGGAPQTVPAAFRRHEARLRTSACVSIPSQVPAQNALASKSATSSTPERPGIETPKVAWLQPVIAGSARSPGRPASRNPGRDTLTLGQGR
jgi:hypothetical protein